MLQSFSCILVYTKSCGSPSMKSSIPPIHTNTNFMLCYAQIKNVFLWLKRYNHIFTLLPTEYIKIWFYLCLYLFLIYHRLFFLEDFLNLTDKVDISQLLLVIDFLNLTGKVDILQLLCWLTFHKCAKKNEKKIYN